MTPEVATDLISEALQLVMLLVTLLVLPVVGLMGRWMVGTLMDFCVSIFERAASLVA